MIHVVVFLIVVTLYTAPMLAIAFSLFLFGINATLLIEGYQPGDVFRASPNKTPCCLDLAVWRPVRGCDCEERCHDLIAWQAFHLWSPTLVRLVAGGMNRLLYPLLYPSFQLDVRGTVYLTPVALLWALTEVHFASGSIALVWRPAPFILAFVALDLVLWAFQAGREPHRYTDESAVISDIPAWVEVPPKEQP